MRIMLGLKLNAVIGLLACVAIGISLFAIHVTGEEEARAATTDGIWSRGLLARTLAQAIEHAVAQATTVYSAEDASEAKGRFAGLQTALAEVERSRSAFLAAMDGQRPPEQLRKLDLAIKEFVAYQTDTAQLGLTVSPKAALIQALDEATVRNRERMVASIDALSRDDIFRVIGATITQMNTIAADVEMAASHQGEASQSIANALRDTARETEATSASVDGLRAAATSNEEQATLVHGSAFRVSEGARALSATIDTFLARVHAA